MDSFGEWFWRRRMHLGIPTQEALAQASGVSLSVVQKVEADKLPLIGRSDPIRAALAAALQVRLDVLETIAKANGRNGDLYLQATPASDGMSEAGNDEQPIVLSDGLRRIILEEAKLEGLSPGELLTAIIMDRRGRRESKGHA